MKRLREWTKTALIYLLIAAALAQTVMLWDAFLSGESSGSIMDRMFGEERPVYEGQPVYEQLSYALDLIRPLGAAVRTMDGGLYAAGSREEAAAVFERATLTVTEALDGADLPSLVTSSQWQEALESPMLLLDFGGTVKLPTLAYLMGAGEAGNLEGELRWLVLAEQDGLVRIYYKSNERGIYSMETSVSAGGLVSLCGQYESNGGWFGYEKGIAEARDVLLMKQGREYPVVTQTLIASELGEAEYDRMTAAVLEGFGFNAYTVGSYTESDGAQVYVEDERVLRMSKEGRVSFTDMSGMIPAGEPDVEASAERIGEVSKLAAEVLAPWIGDAGMYLLEAGYDEESGDFVVEIALSIGGEKLVTPQGFVLRAAYRGSRLMAADMEMKSYRYAGETVTLMPAEQAMAAVGGKAGFGMYYAGENDRIEPNWYVID